MKRTAYLILLLVFPAKVTAGRFDEAAVDKLVQDTMKLWQVPGLSIAVVHKDQVIYLKGFGVRRLGQPEPMTPCTIFAIGSTTKGFTTTAMAMLVDDGKMAWDDPVRDYIDWFRLADPLADANVTLRDLVCHRTGLEGHDSLWYGTSLNQEDILRRVAYLPVGHSFRSVWDYNNLMYSAAGYAAGRAAGCTWEELVQKRIFDPLGMTGANFTTAAAQKSPDHATPHHKKNKVEPISWRNLENIGPAGSINAGAADMARWIRMQLGKGRFEGKKLISATGLAKTHEPQMVIQMEGLDLMFPETVQTSYGLGWLVQDYHGRPLVSHNGGIDGFSAQVTLFPRDNLGIVVLANRGDVQNMELAIAQQIADSILDLPKKNWPARVFLLESVGKLARPLADLASTKKQRPGTQPSRELDAYTGTYADMAYGAATVSLEDGSLRIKLDNFQLQLTHFHFNTFKGKWNDPLIEEEDDVQFQLDSNGDVQEMKVARLADFRRIKPKP
jgi:CubicO group peptidase (beta-lactamase class C family)